MLEDIISLLFSVTIYIMFPKSSDQSKCLPDEPRSSRNLKLSVANGELQGHQRRTTACVVHRFGSFEEQ
ncbi:hypothetical protein L2E82_20309 [Cichorium intybus]|uniref:Uncharacterized protein n=1 Tax=Cichorium intybus TaxID=13427 RepID=A0ACB9DSM1_CICIN|nr:hypothetical protein L2E82_20309 [Cichorium intybus]